MQITPANLKNIENSIETKIKEFKFDKICEYLVLKKILNKIYKNQDNFIQITDKIEIIDSDNKTLYSYTFDDTIEQRIISNLVIKDLIGFQIDHFYKNDFFDNHPNHIKGFIYNLSKDSLNNSLVYKYPITPIKETIDFRGIEESVQDITLAITKKVLFDIVTTGSISIDESSDLLNYVTEFGNNKNAWAIVSSKSLKEVFNLTVENDNLTYVTEINGVKIYSSKLDLLNGHNLLIGSKTHGEIGNNYTIAPTILADVEDNKINYHIHYFNFSTLSPNNNPYYFHGF